MNYLLHNPPVARKRGVFRTLVWVAVVVSVLILGAVIAGRWYYLRQLQPVSDSQAVVLLDIEPGTAAAAIGDDLQTKGLIRSSQAFQWYLRIENARDKLQAGTYALRPNMNVKEIVEVLANGSVQSDLLTILPGQRLDQIRQAFINAGFQTAAVDAALQPQRYSGHPAFAGKPADVNLEGYLFPESYQKTASTDPAQIITAALDQTARALTPDVRAGIAAQGLSVYQGVILASMVEQEVSSTADSPVVAQVFLKRLKDDMVLGSDVTSIYGSILAGRSPSVNYPSPYNTHSNKGLPPTPISNISQRSLSAVAKPAQTDWVFFVAGDDGKTYFSRTVEEHNALVERHCKRLCNL